VTPYWGDVIIAVIIMDTVTLEAGELTADSGESVISRLTDAVAS